MKNTILFFLVLCGFLGSPLYGQVNDFARFPDPQLFKECTSTGWVKFVDGLAFHPDLFFEEHGPSFGIDMTFQMKPFRIREDEYGFTHVKYQQYHQQVKIKGGVYILHAKEGHAVSGNGHIIIPSSIRSENRLTEASALQTALQHVQAKKYYWEDPEKEARLKSNRNTMFHSYYPSAEMVYIWKPESNQLILTYAFAIYAIDPGKSGKYYVNAADATIEEIQPVEYTCDHTTFLSNWYNIKDIWTNDVGVFETSYDLEDDCQASVYGVYYTNGIIFNTPDNNWNTDWLRSAAQSLFSIKISYLWFNIFFSRLGHDDDDGNLDITQGFVFENGNNNNASYTYDEFGDDEIRVGIGNTPSVLDDYNCIDILAHEFTHGITQYEANLAYQMESGALNESFSDIFGEWLEFKELGNNNWLIGNDLFVNGCPNPLRYMVDPAAGNIGSPPCTTNFNDPNTYQGANWVNQAGCVPAGGSTGNDFCGVHTNSGVQNQMFYLLSVGGNGWNNGQTCHAAANNGYFWSVGAIGIDAAARIAYRVLVDYLTPNSTYFDSRNAWVHAAEDLFGVCSYQAIQTGRAWWAVGIAPPPPGNMVLCNVIYGITPQTISTPDNITTQPGCFVTIANTGNLVEFISGGKIHLQDGFRATWGSNFNTTVTDCYFANY